MLSRLITVARNLLAEVGLFEQPMSYPGFASNEEIDQWD